MKHETRIHVEYAPWAGREPYLLRYVQYAGENRMHVAESVVMRTVDEGAVVEPLLRLDGTAAQQLMDALWLAGVRPAEVRVDGGQVDAMKLHLADMRRLVFQAYPGDKA